MNSLTKKISLCAVLVLAVLFSYEGRHYSNGNNMGNVVSDTDNIFTPVVSSILAPPVPVKGSDGNIILPMSLT